MAGGGSALNVFKLSRGGDPKEVLNWRLWLAVFSFGLMGAARGIDEGLISGTIASKYFLAQLGLDKLSKADAAAVNGNISAMVQIGSVGGALIAFLVCDRIGRLWATRQLCLLWVLGIVIFMTNGGRLGQVYAGRFIAGLGIGQTTVVAPVYLSEIAPKSIRGLCCTTFAGAVYIGIMLAYFTTYGCQLNIGDTTNQRWLVPTSLHLIFAGIVFILTFFNYESPRYLVSVGKDEQALRNLSYVRNLPVNDPYVLKEISGIQMQLQEEREATMGSGWLGYVKEMFFIPNNFYRIYLGLGSQLLGQWSGANSITIYAPQFFALLGTTGDNEKLFATAIFGVVKFVAAIICAFFLVDFIGRKKALSIGIGLQALAMLYIALFLTIAGTPSTGVNYTSSQTHAATGAIVMIYVSGFGWAMGWNTIQYLLNAEIYPLRIRAASSSLVMCFHFVNQYGNSKAVPIMLLPGSEGGISPAGTFWTFTAITVVGLFWAWFSIPETAGRSLESMDRLFTLRWWQIGRFGAAEGAALDDVAMVDDEKVEMEREKDGTVVMVENKESV